MMSMKELRKRSQDALANLDKTPVPGAVRPTTGRPMTSPGAAAMMQPTIDALNQRAKDAELEATALRQQMADNPGEVMLDQLVEVEGRRRHLTPEEFEELRKNLEANPLVHPIVVRRIDGTTSDGRPLYEVISGYNRLAILRLLGRKTAPIRVLSVEEEQADSASFWANLLQPSLSDYEKYLGFKRVQEKTGLPRSELAQRAGISKQSLARYFAFEGLPPEVIEILEGQPTILGGTRCAELVQLVKGGQSAAVISAVQDLANGLITQDEAVAKARLGRIATKRSQGRVVQASTTQIRSGRLDFCRMVSRGTSLRLEFKNEEHRQAADSLVEKLMRDLADSAAPGKDGAK